MFVGYACSGSYNLIVGIHLFNKVLLLVLNEPLSMIKWACVRNIENGNTRENDTCQVKWIGLALFKLNNWSYNNDIEIDNFIL